MIIPVESTGSTSKVAQLDTAGTPEQPKDEAPRDPPPSYTPTPDSDAIPGAIADMAPNQSRRDTPRAPAQKPTNMVFISKLSGSVKGFWVIDPAIVIPAALLPKSQYPNFGLTDEPRTNLLLKTNNGAIAADVTLVPRASESIKDGRSRITLAATTFNGSVKFALREAPTDASPRPERLPIKLTAESMNGGISVSIPRSFRGIVHGTTFNGSVKLSDEVNAQVTYEKADGRTRRIFVGNFSDDDFAGGEEWLGDEVFADTKSGSIKIRYEDEGECAPDEGGSNKARSGGLFTKIWEAIF